MTRITMTSVSQLKISFVGDSWADINEEEEEKERIVRAKTDKKCITQKKPVPEVQKEAKIWDSKCSNGKMCQRAYYQYGLSSNTKKREIKHEIKCKFEHTPEEIAYFIKLAKEIEYARICINGTNCTTKGCRFNHKHDYLFT